MSKSPAGTVPISKRLQLIRTRPFLASENTPEQLVTWLNSSRKGIPRSRIVCILELLQQQKAISSLGKARTEAERLRFVGIIRGVTCDWLKLDDLLARYWISPRVFFLPEGPRMFYAIADDTNGSKGKAGRNEISAAMCVLRLAARDELDRVRKCSCGKFFVAGRVDQIHCSTRCRVRYYQSSEEFKAKRREYLRQLYRLKKTGSVL